MKDAAGSCAVNTNRHDARLTLGVQGMAGTPVHGGRAVGEASPEGKAAAFNPVRIAGAEARRW